MPFKGKLRFNETKTRMFDKEQISRFGAFATPFYYYDIKLLRETLTRLKAAVDKYGYCVHYAVKANANPRILQEISAFGFGATA